MAEISDNVLVPGMRMAHTPLMQTTRPLQPVLEKNRRVITSSTLRMARYLNTDLQEVVALFAALTLGFCRHQLSISKREIRHLF